MRAIGFIAAAGFLSSAALAGQLVIGQPQVGNTRVTVPVTLEGEVAEGVAAMDFTVNFDPAILAPIDAAPGSATSGAGKQIYGAPTGSGQYVVVVMGLEDTTLTSGEVARITFDRVGIPPDGRSGIAITKTTFASSAGAEVPSEGSTASVPLESDAPPENPPPPPEPDDNEEEPPGPAGPPDGAGTAPDGLPQPIDAAAIATGGSNDTVTVDAGEPEVSAAALIARLQAATSRAERMRALLPTPADTPGNGGPGEAAPEADARSEMSSAEDGIRPLSDSTGELPDRDANVETTGIGQSQDGGTSGPSPQSLSPSENEAGSSNKSEKPLWLYRAMLIVGCALIVAAIIHHRRRMAN